MTPLAEPLELSSAASAQSCLAATIPTAVAADALISVWGLSLSEPARDGIFVAVRAHIVATQLDSGKRSASRRLSEDAKILNARERRLRKAADEISRFLREDQQADLPYQLSAMLGPAAWRQVEHILSEVVATIALAQDIDNAVRRPKHKAGGEKHPTWNSLVRNVGADYVTAGGDTDDPRFVKGFLAMNNALSGRARASSDAALAKRVRRIFPASKRGQAPAKRLPPFADLSFARAPGNQ